MKSLNLVYNEFVKQFKKLSTKVLIIAILISAIVLPIMMKNIKPQEKINYSKESVEFWIQDCEKQLETLKGNKSQNVAIKRKYIEIELEYNKLLLEQNIYNDSWEYTEASKYKSAMTSLAAIQFVLDGYEKDVVLRNLQEMDENVVSGYFELSLEKRKDIEFKYIDLSNELKEVIVTRNYNKHTELEIQRKKEKIQSFKSDINEYEKLSVKKPTTEEGNAQLKVLREKKDEADKMIPRDEQDLSILKFRLDNNISYDKSNWKHNAIMAINNELFNIRQDMMDEREFNSKQNEYNFANTYEEYVENYKKGIEARVLKIKELWYGLENNIPDLDSVKDARSTIDELYELYVVLAVVVAIIIGGTIVASEYGTGSIRLLLIRPVSRWKVLLSKLLTVLIFGYAIVICGVVLLVVSSGIAFGFESLKVPVLQTISGSVTEIDYIRYMLPQLCDSTASLIFITSLVFMISTLSRNTAVAVALGMLVYGGVAPLSEMLISFKQLWIINTFILYINSSYFKLIPSLSNMLQDSGLSLNFGVGAQQLLIVSAVLVIITFITFVKKDIKN